MAFSLLLPIHVEVRNAALSGAAWATLPLALFLRLPGHMDTALCVLHVVVDAWLLLLAQNPLWGRRRVNLGGQLIYNACASAVWACVLNRSDDIRAGTTSTNFGFFPAFDPAYLRQVLLCLLQLLSIRAAAAVLVTWFATPKPSRAQPSLQAPSSGIQAAAGATGNPAAASGSNTSTDARICDAGVYRCLQLAGAAQDDDEGCTGLKPQLPKAAQSHAAPCADVGWRSALMRALGMERVPAEEEAAAFALFTESFVLSTSRTGQTTDMLLLLSCFLQGYFVQGRSPFCALNAYACLYLGPGCACTLARLLLPHLPLPRPLAARGAALVEAMSRALRLPRLGLQLFVHMLTAVGALPVPPALASSFFRGPSFPLLVGVIKPITDLVPLWAAVALAVIKVPLQFGNMRINMSAAAVSSAPAAAGHGEVMGSTEAWLRAVSVELLAVATTLGCHTYLWREFGRRRQSKRLRLEDGQGQGQPQQQQHEQEHEEKQGARAAAAKGGMAQAKAAAADEAGMKVEEHVATMAAVAAGSRSAAATQQARQVQQHHRPQEVPPLQQARQVQQHHRPQEVPPLQQPCQRPPPYRAVCRRTSLVVKIPWAEPEDLTPAFRRRLVGLAAAARQGANNDRRGKPSNVLGGSTSSRPGDGSSCGSGQQQQGATGGMVMMAAAVRRGCIELVMVLGLRRGALPGGRGGADGSSRLSGCLSGLGQDAHLAGDDGSRSKGGDGVVCAGGGVELPFSLLEMLTTVGLLDSNGRPQAALAAALGDGEGEGGAKTGEGRPAARDLQQLLSELQVRFVDLEDDAGAEDTAAPPGLRVQGLGPRVLLLPSPPALATAGPQPPRGELQHPAADGPRAQRLPPLLLRARLGLGSDWDGGAMPEVEAGLMLMGSGTSCVPCRVRPLGPVRPRQQATTAAAPTSTVGTAPVESAVAEWEVEVEVTVEFGAGQLTPGGLLLDLRVREPQGSPAAAATAAAAAAASPARMRRAYVPLVATDDGELAAEVTALVKGWPDPSSGGGRGGMDSFLLDVGYWLQASPAEAEAEAEAEAGAADAEKTAAEEVQAEETAAATASEGLEARVSAPWAEAAAAAAEAQLQADIAEGLLSYVRREGQMPVTAARLGADVEVLRRRAMRLQQAGGREVGAQQQQQASHPALLPAAQRAQREEPASGRVVAVASKPQSSKANGDRDDKAVSRVTGPASTTSPKGKGAAGGAAGEASRTGGAGTCKQRMSSYEGCSAAAATGDVAGRCMGEGGSAEGNPHISWMSALLCVVGLVRIPAAQRQAFIVFADRAMLPFTLTGHMVDAVVLAAVLWSTLRAGVSPLDSVMLPAMGTLGMGAAGALAQLLLPQRASERLATALRLPCHVSAVVMKVLTTAHVLPHPLTSLPYYSRLAFPLREGLMAPMTCLVSPAAALVLCVLKVPVNTAVLLDVGVAAHLPAALVRVLAVELLALATTLGCHAYLWREFGRRQGLRQAQRQLRQC